MRTLMRSFKCHPAPILHISRIEARAELSHRNVHSATNASIIEAIPDQLSIASGGQDSAR